MRKSERIRQLELQLVEQSFRINLLETYILTLLESQSIDPALDAGKWYRRKPTEDNS